MKTANKQPVAHVCMYGNSQIGAGWIAQLTDGRLLGNGEPRTHLGFTAALQLAKDAIKTAGVLYGTIRVFMTGGHRMADINLNKFEYYGEIKWVPAAMLEVRTADLKAAAVNK